MWGLSRPQCRCFAFSVLVLVLSVGTVPTLGDDDSLSKHYGFVNQQDFYSILKSIESKLGNIDQVLIRETNYNMRDDLTAIQRRLDILEDKITHLQSTNSKCMENIHEEVKNNMVNVKKAIQKDFWDILTKTSAERQDSDNIILKLEKIEDELTSRDEETKTELSDIVALLEDLRTSCPSKDTYSDTDNTETTDNPQVNKYNDTCKIIPEELEEIKQDIYSQNEFANWTTNFLLAMKNELQQDMNNYANKVADMNLENWESNKLLGEKIKSLQKFMVQMSRRLQRNSTSDSPPANELDEITRHMNSNFEKILSTQNLFLESCYKLQNDDSQIEFKLGNLLHVIAQKLEEKAIIGTERIENIAMLITDHNDLMKHYILTKNYYHDDVIKRHENNRKARNSIDTKTLSSTMNDETPFFPYASLKGILQGSRDENYAMLTQSKLIEAHIIETQQNWLTPERNYLSEPKSSKIDTAIGLENDDMDSISSLSNINTLNENGNNHNLVNMKTLNEKLLTQKTGLDENSDDKNINIKKIVKNINIKKVDTSNTASGKYNMNGTTGGRNENKESDSKLMKEVMKLLLNSTDNYTVEHGDMNITNINYDIVPDRINEDQYDRTTPGNLIEHSQNIIANDNYAIEQQTATP